MHTPGPWQFYELLDRAHDGLGYIRTVPEDGLEIAHHGDSGRSRSENVANGHLLAAAPDMLAALYAAQDAMLGIIGLVELIIPTLEGSQRLGVEFNPRFDAANAAVTLIDAAIAKAETP